MHKLETINFITMIYVALVILLLTIPQTIWAQFMEPSDRHDFFPWDRKYVKCGICKAVIDEIYEKISTTPLFKRLEKPGYTLDENFKKSRKPAAQPKISELFLSQMMDGICEKMNEYVRAEHRETGVVEVMKLIIDQTMNPELKDYDILKDGDLESLPFYCDSVVSEFEEEIVEMLLGDKSATDVKYAVCLNSQICMSEAGSSVKEEL